MEDAVMSARFSGLLDASEIVVDLVDRDATLAFGQVLGRALHALVMGHVLPGAFVGLVGGLGAGKTTFMQGFVSGIDAGAEASSPTYALVNVYALEIPIVHMDLYRLEDIDDLESVGYWDYLESEDRILCVEWIDRIEQAWPGEGILIALEASDGGRRVRMWGSRAYAGLLSEVSEEFARGTQTIE